MNLLNIGINPLTVVAGYLIENPKDLVNFSKACKTTNKVAKKITEHSVFAPLKSLCQQKQEKQKRLFELRGSSGFNGIINDAWEKREEKKKAIIEKIQKLSLVHSTYGPLSNEAKLILAEIGQDLKNHYHGLMEEYDRLAGKDLNPGEISTLSQQIEEDAKKVAQAFLKKTG